MGKEVVSISSDSAKGDSTSSMTNLMEDASSSSSSSSSLSLNGPLYQLSELMTHLPIKRRGLSKHYQGKSQSFTSMTSVKSLEDLAKKENPYNKRMKLCRSYGVGLDHHHHHRGQRFCTPKPTIAKKSSSSRAPFLATMVGRNNDLLSVIPMHK